MNTDAREAASLFARYGLDAALPLLDLRNPQHYRQGHFPGATHLPLPDLRWRRHELPAPGAVLQVLHDDASLLQQAINCLQQWGYVISAQRCLDAAAFSTRDAWQTGSVSRPLWRPTDTLQQAIAQGWANSETHVASTPLRALDLACGSGRDALWLAQRGFQVLAVDNKLDVLARLQGSARAWHCPVATLCRDLEAGPLQLPRSGFAVVTVARYLHRPLLPQLADWLAPGGLLVYETFAQGAERFGSPRRPAFLLAPGELARQFAGWQILRDVIQPLPDGRPVQAFIARRPV